MSLKTTRRTRFLALLESLKSALTVQQSPLLAAYNLSMQARTSRLLFLLALTAMPVWSQQPAATSSPPQTLPKARLWEPYQVQLQTSGGIEPYHWRLIAGSLPRGFALNEHGELTGISDENGIFEFTVLVRDSSRPAKEIELQFVLAFETPLTVDWQKKASVNGQRIDGSVKVSNRTGRDVELTFIVLAVNDIGRATAIGYQHFPLKRDTIDMEIPFGDTPSPGNYVVNVDVVGEQLESGRIFRTRLVTEKESITEGP
jgi:hypothetical protein